MPDVKIQGPEIPRSEEILTESALAFVATLQRRFDDRRLALLEARTLRRGPPDFLPETASIRDADWQVSPAPADLLDRRVEITGPPSRKMLINALNSGATHYMADLEDATSPTWFNVVDGQVNLKDAVRRDVTFHDPRKGKDYALDDTIATLLVRPRGWHLDERHATVDGRAVSASLFDFGLYVFHNVQAALARGTGIYLYLPKLEHHDEAKLWDDVFVFAEDTLGVPRGTIRVTVLVETLPAAFQLDEILYALREHIVGLNCGRWDYIFSTIKHLDDRVLPDRGQVGMTAPFMQAYTRLVIRTCHRRGAHAMGGMAAQIPLKDPQANAAALEKVRVDKVREVTDGHDGTWVAHPGLVPLAREVFDAHMPGPNQLDRMRDDGIGRDDLLHLPDGTRTLAGVRQNVQVGVRYLEAWLRGQGCVPLFGLMEDAATAEISRTQLWQWRRHGALLEDGTPVTGALIDAELDALLATDEARAPGRRFTEAADLFRRLVHSDRLEPFLTVPAYEQLLTLEAP